MYIHSKVIRLSQSPCLLLPMLKMLEIHSFRISEICITITYDDHGVL